jgi:ribosomal-protein-alanine N-acetyltransferase
MDELKIVPMEERHLDALVRLEQACFSAPWSRAGLAAELSNLGAVFAVAELNGVTVGYAGMNCVLDECYVDNVAVFLQYRRRGIARALMQHLIAAAQERNAAFITLEARISNTGAISLYESLGFREAGRRPGFYNHPKEDALILTKYFNKSDAEAEEMPVSAAMQKG